MRPAASGGAGTPSRPRPRPRPVAAVQNVFEDFKPLSEWQQDEESDILLLFLPGFMRQHLKVSTEGRNIVRVGGERLVTGNKWSRFQEDYQVPERCNITAIRARFEGGILTVTMPWKKDAAAKATLPTEVPPKATSSIDKNTDQKQQISPPKAPIEQRSKQSADEIPPKVLDPTSTPQKAAAEIHPKGLDPLSRPHKCTDEIQPKKLAPPSIAADKGSKDDEKRLSQPQTQKGHQDQRNRARSPGIIQPMTTSMTISSDDGLGNYKRAVQSLAELNEERQLLVNIGVAVMVIVALGAYIASRIGSEEA